MHVAVPDDAVAPAALDVDALPPVAVAARPDLRDVQVVRVQVHRLRVLQPAQQQLARLLRDRLVAELALRDRLLEVHSAQQAQEDRRLLHRRLQPVRLQVQRGLQHVDLFSGEPQLVLVRGTWKCHDGVALVEAAALRARRLVQLALQRREQDLRRGLLQRSALRDELLQVLVRVERHGVLARLHLLGGLLFLLVPLHRHLQALSQLGRIARGLIDMLTAPLVLQTSAGLQLPKQRALAVQEQRGAAERPRHGPERRHTGRSGAYNVSAHWKHRW